MTAHLVTFSDASMGRSAELCVESAMRNGVSCGLTYSPTGIAQSQEVKDNSQVFSQPSDPRRAWGWWAWKPLVIGWWMEGMVVNDVIIYADAGVEFVNSVNHIIDRMDQDIFLFGNNYEHAHWCKRDILGKVWPSFTARRKTEPRYWIDSWERFGKQVQASVIFFRVNDKTRAFVKEWLDWCLFEGGRLIDDSPSVLPNHPEFRENRHDQAILTTLAYREGYRLHYWPASYNNGAFTYEKLPCYAGDDYPILFNHHRRRNHEWISAA